jgi:hypothetical protein
MKRKGSCYVKEMAEENVCQATTKASEMLSRITLIVLNKFNRIQTGEISIQPKNIDEFKTEGRIHCVYTNDIKKSHMYRAKVTGPVEADLKKTSK